MMVLIGRMTQIFGKRGKAFPFDPFVNKGIKVVEILNLVCLLGVFIIVIGLLVWGSMGED